MAIFTLQKYLYYRAKELHECAQTVKCGKYVFLLLLLRYFVKNTSPEQHVFVFFVVVVWWVRASMLCMSSDFRETHFTRGILFFKCWQTFLATRKMRECRALSRIWFLVRIWCYTDQPTLCYAWGITVAKFPKRFNCIYTVLLNTYSLANK